MINDRTYIPTGAQGVPLKTRVMEYYKHKSQMSIYLPDPEPEERDSYRSVNMMNTYNEDRGELQKKLREAEERSQMYARMYERPGGYANNSYMPPPPPSQPQYVPSVPYNQQAQYMHQPVHMPQMPYVPQPQYVQQLFYGQQPLPMSKNTNEDPLQAMLSTLSDEQVQQLYNTRSNKNPPNGSGFP